MFVCHALFTLKLVLFDANLLYTSSFTGLSKMTINLRKFGNRSLPDITNINSSLYNNSITVGVNS